jgi:hypothetical protein
VLLAPQRRDHGFSSNGPIIRIPNFSDSAITSALSSEAISRSISSMPPGISNTFQDPPVIKAKLQQILHRLSCVDAGPGDDGNIDPTTKRLSDQVARQIAQDIVRLYVEVCGGSPFGGSGE